MAHLLQEDIDWIREQDRKGMAKKAIARHLGVTPKTVRYWIDDEKRAYWNEASKRHEVLRDTVVKNAKERAKRRARGLKRAPTGSHACPNGLSTYYWGWAREVLGTSRRNVPTRRVYDILRIGTCQATGVSFERHGNPLMRPSIDRIVTGEDGGEYIAKNIQVVTRGYNFMRNKFSVEQAADWLRGHQGGT